MFKDALTSVQNRYVLITIGILLFTGMSLLFSIRYLSLFGINFFEFSDLSDAYNLTLSQGVFIPIIMSFGLIMGLFIFLVIILLPLLLSLRQTKSSEITFKGDLLEPLKYIVFLIGGIFLTVIVTSPLTTLPAEHAGPIKNGFSERYNVLGNNENNICLLIIGGSSDYFFFWDYSNNRPKIILRSKITSLDQVVPRAPTKFIAAKWPPGSMSDSMYAVRKEKLLQTQSAWSVMLEKECSQRVVWPKL